jgi:predicted dithiol-disulfide oxidoreductase (DUF899 family)
VTEQKVGTREEWLAARLRLLEREKKLSRLNDELVRETRELPWVRIEKESRFETDEGGDHDGVATLRHDEYEGSGRTA